MDFKWNLLIDLAFLAGFVIGVALTVLSVRLGAQVAGSLTGIARKSATTQAETLPFVIKDDAKEQQIELEALGYKPLQEFDHVDGLGR